jgi:hypothetical protein
LSSLNYSGDSIIERIPDADAPEITNRFISLKIHCAILLKMKIPAKLFCQTS